MTTLTLTMDDEKADRLKAVADELGVSVEELVAQGVEEYLARREEIIRRASAYVLRKNEELYRRLA